MSEREHRNPSEELSAHFDGELRGLARWRLARRLRRDPRQRRELELFETIGSVLREEADAAAPATDLWDRVALRLPAADARRAEALAGAHRRRRTWLVGGPLGAAVAAGLAALAIGLWGGGEPGTSNGVVRWMYAGKRNVVVLEEPGAPGATIIWVLDESASKDAAGRRSGEMA